MTKGEILIAQLQNVFTLLSAKRDEQASKLLQKVFDELQEIE